ncbi:MAG: hypothetical protein MUP17_04185, partial [candidate division Zixibacteria bacterium]|nr:hypothetical protein [candidate division Zixibacteria bacterium]
MRGLFFTFLFCLISFEFSSGAFEEKPGSARGLSLAGATSSLSSESSHLLSNPASTGLLSKKEIQLSWSKLFGLDELSQGDLYLTLPLNKRCNRNIIMSCFSKVEMSYFEIATISYFKGGYYGRKGHDQDESRGDKKG